MSNQHDMQSSWENSLLFSGNTDYLEQLYEDYLRDPHSVPEKWQAYFVSLPTVVEGGAPDVSHAAIKAHFLDLAKHPIQATSFSDAASSQQAHISELINAYRAHGHRAASLDPLGMRPIEFVEDLDPAYHGFSAKDANTVFLTNHFKGIDKPQASLREIHEALKKIYTGNIGIEFMHISDNAQRLWLQDYMESAKGLPIFSQDEQREILKQLTAAEGLEVYLGKKYVGQKRFSLEGSDSLIPLLNDMVRQAAKIDLHECVIGMAHRGRLNVLVNMLGKSPSVLFQEFEGVYHDEDRTGDVKYHLGFSSDVQTPEGSVHLALGFNPSHLEIISPVIEGAVRARQDIQKDIHRNKIIPIAIHGDAAFAGQGVVMETFNMSQARGYCTGGTIHIVINNQIGFTTSEPLDARSSLYCTDVAKMVEAPIIHVNGDDPEAVVFAGRLALAFRHAFHKDVVIDLVSYRRHGHNESDEPTITQPVMYQKIKAHPTPLTIYADKLLANKVLSQADIELMAKAYREILDKGQSVVPLSTDPSLLAERSLWKLFANKVNRVEDIVKTGVPKARLIELGKKLNSVPAGFSIQPQVNREIENRHKMMDESMPLFWGMAELLAYATLLTEGYPVRISGQDCGRGTFSHRHAVLHDYQNGNAYVPLSHLSDEQSDFLVIDSVLSEEAVLAFEYGYSGTDPHRLVIWEAQFGDFFNGAQVVIDQFISSGEQKWGKLNALVMFLPHGYEGMGPEHSSARLERFLQLCAQHNMQVCVPTTPAQAFHMIRRQMIADYRKPLVVMTPKSLLRHKMAVSSLDELANGHFMPLIPEQAAHEPQAIQRVIICSGKVYYDLLAYREENQRHEVAILRVEQLYPFPEEALKHVLAGYHNVNTVVWCQEEPKNQGAWYHIRHHLQDCLAEGQRLFYAGRDAFAAPAVGYHTLHVKQQKALIEEAFSVQKL
jgi:2-oxoglutarate dehydrogenase E1 component